MVGAGGLAMGRVQRTDAGVGVERNKKGKSKKKKEQTYKDRKDFLLLARQKKRRPAQKQKSVEQRKKQINRRICKRKRKENRHAGLRLAGDLPAGSLRPLPLLPNPIKTQSDPLHANQSQNLTLMPREISRIAAKPSETQSKLGKTQDDYVTLGKTR